MDSIKHSIPKSKLAGSISLQAAVGGCPLNASCNSAGPPVTEKKNALKHGFRCMEFPETRLPFSAFWAVQAILILLPPSRPTRPVGVPRHQGYQDDLDDQQQGICRDIGPTEAEATF